MSEEYYANALSMGLENNKPALFDQFSARAAMTGWPEDVVKDISLQVNNNDLYLDYNEGLSDQISNLEYGSLDVPARAAIRNFTGEVNQTISDIFAEVGLDALFERGVFS